RELLLIQETCRIDHRNGVSVDQSDSAIPRAFRSREARRQREQHSHPFHAVNCFHQKRDSRMPQKYRVFRARRRQPKMLKATHHKKRAVPSPQQMPHFTNRWARHFRRRGEAVRIANFVHRARADRKHLPGDREQNHRLAATRAPRPLRFARRDFHRSTACGAVASSRTRFSIAAAIWSSGSTCVTNPLLITSAGIPKITEVASSCTNTLPPAE